MYQDSHSRSNCLVCDAPAKPCFSIGQFPIRECAACQFRFVAETISADHVAAHYDDDYFFGGGAGYNDYLASEQIIREQASQYERLARELTSSNSQVESRRSILSIGTASGFDLLTFRDAGWDVAGVEPNATMVRKANERGLAVDCASLESYPVSRRYDVVTAVQVIAHVTDVQLAARKLADLVAPGGLALIETWNYRSWTARLLGLKWHEYSPPTVLQWFTPKSLGKLLKSHGLECVRQGRPKKSIRGDHAKSLLSYRLAQHLPEKLARWCVAPIPKSLVIPYPADDLFWMAFRRI